MDKENTSELDKLFENLPKDEKDEADVFNDKPQVPAKDEVKKDEVISGEEEPRKNRRHRRWESQLSEREKELTRREAFLAGQSEAAKFSKDASDIDPRWLRIYGDTPESREAWKLQKDILNDYASKTTTDALETIKQAEAKEKKEQQELETYIDTEFEAIEDEFNVDLTSNSPAARKARREFIDLIEELSPKDASGEISDFADFFGVWKIYQAKKEATDKPDVSKNKEIASRSMEKSGSAPTAGKEVTPGFRGWQKDYNINN